MAKPIRRERLAVAALSLVAAYAFFYEYLPPFQQVHLWGDIDGFHYSLQRYAFQALKEGRVPLWDSSIYCGISFAGNVEAALFYPPTWLLYAAVWTSPRLSFKSLEIFAFLHVWLAFVLCYLWLRARTGKLPGVFGAAVFACSGYAMYEFWHLGVLCALPWIPLGLWGIDEAAGRLDSCPLWQAWRPLWKVAAASALTFLAGFPSCAVVFCATAVAYALGSRRRWKLVAGVCLALGFSALLSMAQLLPAMEAHSLMVREPKYTMGDWNWRAQMIAFFVPNWFDFNPGHPASYAPGAISLYLGLPALFAFAWAVRRLEWRRYLQPLIVAAVALALANPGGWLERAVARIPALADVLTPFPFYAGVSVMAALIAAIGLQDFFDRRVSEPLPRWAPPVVIAALAGWSVRQLWIGAHGGAFAVRGASAVEAAIALALFSMGLWSVRKAPSRRYLAAVLLLSTLVDYKVYGANRWFNGAPGDVDDYHPSYGIGGVDDQAYRAMRANRQYRVATYAEAGPEPTAYRYWGLATPAGFDPFLPRQYKDAIERWVPFRTNRLFDVDPQNQEMLQALGVRYILVRSGFPDEPLLAANPNFRLIGAPAAFCRVYEYLHARPPYYWEPEGGEHEGSGTVEPTAWIAERREFLARSEKGGRLVLVEQFFPGWSVTVDGRPALIGRWGGAFQAVPLTAGEHRVRFEFRPRSLRLGAAISLFAAAILIWVACLRPS